MAISDFLAPERIILRESTTKDMLLDELIHIACAALSISTVTAAFAVAISESTRKITVFHAGQRIVEM